MITAHTMTSAAGLDAKRAAHDSSFRFGVRRSALA
jgi:hypothetical protein